LCELHADTLSEDCDNSDKESLDSDSDVPTTGLCKQLRSSAVVVTSDSETSTDEQENSQPESSDGKTSNVWCRTDEKPNIEPFLGTTGPSSITDNPESVVEIVRSVTGDDLILLVTEQSNLYHSLKIEILKVSPKTLKWSTITPEGMRKFLRLIILMGQVKKENITV
jgi:hypothetical protein